MPSTHTRGTLFAVAALTLIASTSQLTPTQAATTTPPTPSATWTPDPKHPYSNPTYMPLRASAEQSCVKTNCPNKPGNFHNYWAIDWDGHFGDPIYAAGAGIVHVHNVTGNCAPANGAVADGNSVWIDHGAGIVSIYRHLKSITVKEGQLVTPATQIGTMGASGDILPCNGAYLHYEVRSGGINGTRIYPGTLTACTNGTTVQLPQEMGATNWNNLKPYITHTPASDNTCLNRHPATPPAPANFHITTRGTTATITWSAPQSTQDTIEIETWSPSAHRWNSPTYRRINANSKTILNGLKHGTTYRIRLFAQNPAGASAPTQPLTLRP